MRLQRHQKLFGLLHATLNKTLGEWKLHWNHIADDFNREHFIEFSSNGCSKEWKGLTLYFRILCEGCDKRLHEEILWKFPHSVSLPIKRNRLLLFPCLSLQSVITLAQYPCVPHSVYRLQDIIVRKYKIHNTHFLLNCYFTDWPGAQAISLLRGITCVTLLIQIHDSICSTKRRTFIFLIG